VRKSTVICVLMMTLVLSACGGGKGDAAQELALTARTAYLAAGGYTGTMTVTADYGQRVYRYRVELAVEGEQTTLTVMEPEEVAGVVASTGPGESRLEYDGTVLETGPLSQDGLSPLGAVPALLEAARSGFMDSCVLEELDRGQALRVFCRDPSGVAGQGREFFLWFDADSCALLRGEILMDGYRVILCEFEQFSLTS